MIAKWGDILSDGRTAKRVSASTDWHSEMQLDHIQGEPVDIPDVLKRSFAQDAARRAEPQHTPYVRAKPGPQIVIRTEREWLYFLSKLFGFRPRRP